jgi:hypothetical protein
MVNSNRRHLPRVGKRPADGSGDQQRPDEPRAGGIGNTVDVAMLSLGAGQGCPHQRRELSYVIAGRQFRDHAAMGAMCLDLRRAQVTEQPAAVVENRGAGVVTARFQA